MLSEWRGQPAGQEWSKTEGCLVLGAQIAAQRAMMTLARGYACRCPISRWMYADGCSKSEWKWRGEILGVQRVLVEGQASLLEGRLSRYEEVARRQSFE